MKFRPVHALFISVLLILGALWSSQSKTKKTQADLIALSELQVQSAKSFESQPNFYIEESATPGEELTNTDLLGRQLIVDYVDLATSGQANPENIKNLADRYVDSVPNLGGAEMLGYESIKVVANTDAAYRTYADELKRIQSQYMVALNKYNSAGNISEVGSELYSFANGLSNIYADASLKLRALYVPASLAPQHLKLLNSFVSSARAAKSIAETEKDPATSFAGLITLSGNFNKEKDIFEQINQILIDRGI